MKISVKVIPKSSENKIVGFEGEVLKVKCTDPPEKGKANKTVIALLAEYYNVPKSTITILRGEKSAKKIIEISGID